MTTSNEQLEQVAVNDIGSQEELLAAIDKTIKYFGDGDIVTGTVVRVDRDEVLLDIGYKTEGVILSRELSIKHDVSPEDVVQVGDEIEALVLQKEDKEGRLLLSKKRAQYERAWGDVQKIKEADGVVTGKVIEVVKGGLILDIGLRGFLPASLVEMRRVRDLAPYIGRELEAKIIELDENRNNVVLSRRAWLEQTQAEVRTQFLDTLQKGQIRSGVVSSIVNFGAFGSGWCRRPGTRIRTFLETYRSPLRSGGSRSGSLGGGSGCGYGSRTGFAVLESHPGRSVADLRSHPRHWAGCAGQSYQTGSLRRLYSGRGRYRRFGTYL